MQTIAKVAIVWGAVLSLAAIIASVPSLTDRFMSNSTTDGLTLLYVTGIMFMGTIVAYLVRNHSTIFTKRFAETYTTRQ